VVETAAQCFAKVKDRKENRLRRGVFSAETGYVVKVRFLDRAEVDCVPFQRNSIWGCSSVGRARGSHSRGQGFESPQLHYNSPLPAPVDSGFGSKEIMSGPYKYDLAISFLADDEGLALEIADRISERLAADVFVYSNRQDELVGRDGLETFSGVFGTQSRVAAVLHREGWGHTLWTRVEETAIKNRAFHEGFDFCC
jgi:hypothetical protein